MTSGHGGHGGDGAQVADLGTALGAWLVPGLLALGLLAAYGVGTSAYRRRRGRPWDARRSASWALGALLIAGAVSPPVSAWAHTDPRGHMAQHLALGMYAPLVSSSPRRSLSSSGRPPPRRADG